MKIEGNIVPYRPKLTLLGVFFKVYYFAQVYLFTYNRYQKAVTCMGQRKHVQFYTYTLRSLTFCNFPAKIKILNMFSKFNQFGYPEDKSPNSLSYSYLHRRLSIETHIKTQIQNKY